MDLLTLLSIFNGGLVLLYGLILSVDVAGGWGERRQRQKIVLLCPLFLLLQGAAWLLWGMESVRLLYPLLVHLPLLLVLALGLKRRWSVSLVSVCTAYLCCQLPRWVGLLVTALIHVPLAGELCYTLSIGPLFFLLRRYFVRAARDAMTHSKPLLLLFGSLPVAYYFFDYATAVYSDALKIDHQALNEFLPTALIVFYVLFLTAYHAQMQRHTQAELQHSMLEATLKQSGAEMENLRRVEAQTAIYQHDMRHHLNALQAFLAAGKVQQAEDYIRSVQTDVASVTPRRFCENDLVNLLCSSFADKAERMGVKFSVAAKLPKELAVSDAELCSLLSNALENALRAAGEAKTNSGWVDLYCGIKHNKLLIEVKNPYVGTVVLRDGIPVAGREGHGYGCRSIRAIAERNRGLCSFEAENEIFLLRVVLPV